MKLKIFFLAFLFTLTAQASFPPQMIWYDAIYNYFFQSLQLHMQQIHVNAIIDPLGDRCQQFTIPGKKRVLKACYTKIIKDHEIKEGIQYQANGKPGFSIWLTRKGIDLEPIGFQNMLMMNYPVPGTSYEDYYNLYVTELNFRITYKNEHSRPSFILILPSFNFFLKLQEFTAGVANIRQYQIDCDDCDDTPIFGVKTYAKNAYNIFYFQKNLTQQISPLTFNKYLSTAVIKPSTQLSAALLGTFFGIGWKI